MATIIDGIATSDKFLNKLAGHVNECSKQNGSVPSLKVILVGENPASIAYVTRKKKIAEKIGIHSEILFFSEDITEEELLALIDKLNNDKVVNGILCQLPLPKHIDSEKVCLSISPEKDVDCFHPYNLGMLVMGKPVFLPCTPAGILMLLKEYGVETAGKKAVVVGRSNIVGRPMSVLLSLKGCDSTVTVVHSGTENPEELCRTADILIVAIGIPKFIGKDSIKPGAAVIDVGMNRITTEEGKAKLVGDTDFEAIQNIAGSITPVPGGVGPMTIALLMANVYNAYCEQNNLNTLQIF